LGDSDTDFNHNSVVTGELRLSPEEDMVRECAPFLFNPCGLILFPVITQYVSARLFRQHQLTDAENPIDGRFTLSVIRPPIPVEARLETSSGGKLSVVAGYKAEPDVCVLF
jgi:hypothetical protein